MENHRQIFAVLARHQRAGDGLISVRQNPHVTPAIVAAAKMMMHKPFFRSWHSAIPELALKEEDTFTAFWPTILIAGPQSDRLQQFWDGGGNFLANVRAGAEHRFCGYADLSFTVVLSQRVFDELQPLLENPQLTLAERQAQRQREQQAILDSIPDYKGPPPDPKILAETEELLAKLRGQKRKETPPPPHEEPF